MYFSSVKEMDLPIIYDNEVHIVFVSEGTVRPAISANLCITSEQFGVRRQKCDNMLSTRNICRQIIKRRVRFVSNLLLNSVRLQWTQKEVLNFGMKFSERWTNSEFQGLNQILYHLVSCLLSDKNIFRQCGKACLVQTCI